MKKLSEIGRYVDFEGEGNDWSDAYGGWIEVEDE